MKTKTPGVVINTSPWIALCACGQTGLLPELYDIIFIPEAVRHEILAGGEEKYGEAEFKSCDWLKVMAISDVSKIRLLHELDRGEAEVIVLAQEQGIGEVIIDERVARMQAHVSGLKVVGSLGLLLRSTKKGLLHRIKPSIDQILNAGINIHEDIVNAVSLRTFSAFSASLREKKFHAEAKGTQGQGNAKELTSPVRAGNTDRNLKGNGIEDIVLGILREAGE